EPVAAIYNFKVKGSIITYNNINIRLGAAAQPATFYAPNVSNFSNTAHVRAVYGWVDSASVTPNDLDGECDVTGYNQVAVFDSMGAYTRQYSTNRVWWIMSLYANQTWGMSYPFSRFTIADFKSAADWCDALVTFSFTYPDGETRSFAHIRSTFNAILEGRSA